MKYSGGHNDFLRSLITRVESSLSLATSLQIFHLLLYFKAHPLFLVIVFRFQTPICKLILLCAAFVTTPLALTTICVNESSRLNPYLEPGFKSEANASVKRGKAKKKTPTKGKRE